MAYAIECALVVLMAGNSNKPTNESLEAEIQAWHQKRLDRLRAEDGWLSLVGLEWLEEGQTLAVPPNTPKRLGVFTRRGKEVFFTPESAVEVTVGGKPFAGGPIRTDADESPDVLRHGTLQFIVIVRGERVGIRIRDSASEVRRNFKGIDRFPVRAEWRKEARFVPAEEGRTVSIPNVLGYTDEVPLAGSAVFAHGGTEYRLDATKEGDQLFFVFGDLTNRKETYGAGRFLYAQSPKDGRLVLDFNRAYNPPCVFTPYATCPLPPKQNKLPLRVEAGELRFQDH